MARRRHCPYEEGSAAHSMLDGGLFGIAEDDRLTGAAAAAYNAGVHAYQCSDIETAIQEFTRAASLAPDEWPIRNNLGVALAQRGHAEEGMEQLRLAARGAGDDPVVLRNIGALHWSQGENADALAALTRASTMPDATSDIWYMLMRVHDSVGEKEKAIEAIARAAELNPESCAAHDNLGVMLQNAGRHEEAAEAYRRAAAADPEHPLPWYNLATVLGAMERWEESEEAYRTHMALDGEHSCPHWELGRVLSRLGRNEEALAEFLVYEELEPEDTRASTSVAVEQMAAGRLDEAEVSLNRAFAAGEADAWMWNVRASLGDRRGDPEGALTAARKATELDPEHTRFAWRVMELLADAGRVEEAVGEAQRRPPEQRDWLGKWLVEHLCEQDRLSDATAVARTVLEWVPREPWALGTLGDLRAQAGVWEEALELFERILTIEPDNAVAALQAAQCLTKLEDAERALSLVDGVLAGTPGDIGAAEVRLWCLLSLGRDEEADAQVEAIERLDPENAYLKELRGEEEKGNHGGAEGTGTG